MQTQTITTGNHILGIYSNSEQELDECFSFLKAGFDNNEAIWIMEQDLTKDKIRKKIEKEWDIQNIEELEAKGDIIITNSREWYYPDGKLYADRIKGKWQKAVDAVLDNKRKGLRAFAATDGFFADGFAQGLVDYEDTLGTVFEIPFIVICAYKVSDIANRMTAEQLSSLHLSHGLHRSFGYNILENPSINQHIALMYDNDNQRDAATTKYINEGLKRNQLCVYASIHMRDKVHQERTSSLIDNYEKNVREGNLFVVDLARHYIAAMTDDFTPFEETKQRLNVAVANRADKHVRLVGDCVSFLFKNRHFDECINLEQWWHHKPFEGSYLCTYPKHLIDKYPYDIHKFRILVNHDIIADSDGNIVSAHISEKESRRH